MNSIVPKLDREDFTVPMLPLDPFKAQEVAEELIQLNDARNVATKLKLPIGNVIKVQATLKEMVKMCRNLILGRSKDIDGTEYEAATSLEDLKQKAMIIASKDVVKFPNTFSESIEAMVAQFNWMIDKVMELSTTEGTFDRYKELIELQNQELEMI
jgi:tetraacyldisaccharide-1-P 4'-kinase